MNGRNIIIPHPLATQGNPAPGFSDTSWCIYCYLWLSECEPGAAPSSPMAFGLASFGLAIFTSFFLGDSTITICRFHPRELLNHRIGLQIRPYALKQTYPEFLMRHFTTTET